VDEREVRKEPRASAQRRELTEQHVDHPTNEPRLVDVDALLIATRPRPSGGSRILRRRQWVVAICLVVVPATLSVTLGFAMYVRSDRYRTALESSLSRILDMSLDIGGVRPLGPSGLILTDLRTQLSLDGGQVFSCARATWQRDDRTPDKRHVLSLVDGWILVGESKWTRTEYERMLTGGLGHRFDAFGVSEVRLESIDVRYERDALRFTASGASGVLFFDPDGTGRVSVDCDRLNGVDVDQAVNISARFTPGDRRLPDFQAIRLAVPSMPMSALGLDELVGSSVSQGRFAGTIDYKTDDGSNTITVAGMIREADLSEYTARLPGGPFRGGFTINVLEAGFKHRRLERLEVNGHVYDVSLHEIAPALVEKDRDAILSLTLDEFSWRDHRLDRLAVSGQCADLSLEAITGLVGKGRITGTASVDVRSLVVVDDVIRFADATVSAVPPVDGPAIISREVIATAAERWLGVNPAALLPETIEYLQLGARLTVENDRLRVRGTHGSDGKTILTIKLFDQPVGILREPELTFAVPDIVGLVRAQRQGVDRDDVRSFWEGLQDRVDATAE